MIMREDLSRFHLNVALQNHEYSEIQASLNRIFDLYF